MPDLKYGAFESNPAVWTDEEAWVCQHDNVWREMNSGEVLAQAAVLTKEQFDQMTKDLPPLPEEAFK